MSLVSGYRKMDVGIPRSHFYRAMLCIALTVLSQDVRPSVCLCPSVCHTPVFYQTIFTAGYSHQSFHMQALRRILGIRWYDKVSNAVVNERTKLPDSYC